MYIHRGPRLYLASDRRTVVPEGDGRAAFLLIADGQSMSAAEAATYGLIVAEGEKGEQPKPNKARQPRENKAG